MDDPRSPGWGELQGKSMHLSAPRQYVFMISLTLALVALISYFLNIPYVALYVPQYQFWLAMIAYSALAVGCMMKGV